MIWSGVHAKAAGCSESISMNIRPSAPGNNSTRLHRAASCSRRTDFNQRASPKMNSRNNVPNAKGVYLPLNSYGIAPRRSTSMPITHHERSIGLGQPPLDALRGVV
jgi:hypothetical protein